VTLGRFQSAEGVDFSAAERLGVDVVRRFTGGRGVLHDAELTYAVVAGTADGVPRGVTASYRYFSAALRAAYEAMGIGAEVIERDRVEASSSACYLSSTRADITLGAMKLSGSAQVWHGSTVLQHGSFVIRRDVEREAALFGLTAEQMSRLESECATIESVTGRAPAIEALVAPVVDAFEALAGVPLVPDVLSDEETATARTLEGAVAVTSSGLSTQTEE
jgi:lipoate-protein ligase A